MPMIPPASWRLVLRLSQTKMAMKNKNGKNESRSTRRLELAPVPVTETLWLLNIPAKAGSFSTTGIWEV